MLRLINIYYLQFIILHKRYNCSYSYRWIHEFLIGPSSAEFLKVVTLGKDLDIFTGVRLNYVSTRESRLQRDSSTTEDWRLVGAKSDLYHFDFVIITIPWFSEMSRMILWHSHPSNYTLINIWSNIFISTIYHACRHSLYALESKCPS